jgi:phosphatidate cytidylyltransferase
VFGSLFGKNNRVKFLSDVSEKKSWAGFVAGAILPIPIIFFTAKAMGLLETNDRNVIIAYCFIAGVVAELGDLIESAAKRTLMVKDSGEALAKLPFFGLFELPLIGHGGYLDRFDSTALSLLAVGFLRIFLSS